MEDLFIELVRENPLIQNKQHISYKDRMGVVGNIWTMITENMRAAEHLLEQFIGKQNTLLSMT